MDTQITGPWIATFRDGALASHDHDRIFAVGPILTDLYFAPAPERAALDWLRVDHGDNQAPEHPWEGELHYRLVDVITMAGADAEPVAYYELT